MVLDLAQNDALRPPGRARSVQHRLRLTALADGDGSFGQAPLLSLSLIGFFQCLLQAKSGLEHKFLAIHRQTELSQMVLPVKRPILWEVFTGVAEPIGSLGPDFLALHRLA